MNQITQKPFFETLPVAQPIIFVVENDTIVQNESLVRFICEVYVSQDYVNVANSSNLIATLKTTPNNRGVGMFDVRPILESSVSPDHLATNEVINTTYDTASTYKGTAFDDNSTAASPYYFPIHIQDKFSLSVNSTRWFRLKFKIEYLGADSNYPNNVLVDENENRSSETYYMFNGVVSNEETLYKLANSWNYGLFLENLSAFDYSAGIIQDVNTARFLSNAPLTQYARYEDYGTIATFSMLNSSSRYSFTTGATSDHNVNVQMIAYDSSGSALFTENISNQVTVSGVHSGGAGGYEQPYSYGNMVFCGAYPGNFKNWSASWTANEANISYYTLQGNTDSGFKCTALYTVHIICANSFGYEGIRLTWLNKYGAWDYYTFNKKSTRSITSKKNSYTQLGGSWNESVYKPNGYRGGKKNFRSSTTEKIKLNTDYLTDSESTWIMELIESPEVYIVNGFQQGDAFGILNKYVEPVLVTTSNFVKKTKANDRLIQYTIDIERNKQQRIQAI
tara:strand:- start:17932 stop:19452 length:1521 start_codon:yes stop_codon:yes gene_type:complete